MDLRNATGRMERGEAFVRAKAELVDTSGLSVHIKFTKAKGRDVNGYYRWDDRRMVLAVKQRLRYPRTAAYGVGTLPRTDRRLGGLPYRLVWHEGLFQSPDDLLVFVAGHEFWHFLCHSGQRKRDHETRANCHGFAWLAEFRTWPGPGTPVAEIPPLPPRPDVPAAATAWQVPGAAGVAAPVAAIIDAMGRVIPAARILPATAHVEPRGTGLAQALVQAQATFAGMAARTADAALRQLRPRPTARPKAADKPGPSDPTDPTDQRPPEQLPLFR